MLQHYVNKYADTSVSLSPTLQAENWLNKLLLAFSMNAVVKCWEQAIPVLF